MTQQTPSDPQQLRDEIEQTRADLADTVAALSAKTNVTARAKEAAAGVGAEAADLAGVAVRRVKSSAVAARASVTDGDLLGAARRPVPIAVIAGAAVLAVVVVYIVRRRRS